MSDDMYPESTLPDVQVAVVAEAAAVAAAVVSCPFFCVLSDADPFAWVFSLLVQGITQWSAALI